MRRIISLFLLLSVMLSLVLSGPVYAEEAETDREELYIQFDELRQVIPGDDTMAAPTFSFTSGNTVYVPVLTMYQIQYKTNAKNVTWSSSDTKSVSVDSNGLCSVKKITRGCTITARASSSGGDTKIATLHIYVDFKDVADSNQYFYSPVYWAVNNKITNGYTDDNGFITGYFGPNDSCTRGQVVTFLYRAAGSPAVNTANGSKFKDVKSSDFFYKAVCWAVSKGITTGYTENGKPTGYFGPNDVCTRGQVVTFLYRAAGSPSVSTNVSVGFNDVKKTDFFYKPILWATQNNITTGYSGQNKFGANDFCTRGQVVTFLQRWKDNA